MNDEEIRKRIDNCPRLGALRSINQTLKELVHAEQQYTGQIAETIRRDPTLTSRLLKTVNSVFFGLSFQVSRIEDAVLYLGLRRIRELGMATPIIEEFSDLNVGFRPVNWRMMWQHNIATAILTREVLSTFGYQYEDDSDYIVGLVHNVGKIVMAFGFSDSFDQILRSNPSEDTEHMELEKRFIGWDHAQLGAYYLEQHFLTDEIVDSVRHHHHPAEAQVSPYLAAAVQLADHLARSVGISGIESHHPTHEAEWRELSGWGILCEEDEETERIAVASLRHTLMLLPTIIKGMV